MDVSETTNQIRPAATGKARRRWVVLTLQVGFGLWLIFMVGGGLWRAFSAQTLVVPHKLGGLEILGAATQGPEALTQMTRLHGKDVGLKDGYVSHYRSGAREAVLYVGQAQSADAAVELTERMRALIAPGGTPFQQLSQRTVEGRTVYRVTGMGAEHYFFSTGDKSVWLSVAGGGGDDILRAAIAEVR